MIENIIFSLIAFVLFTYIFLFKMIRKNDTSYLIIVIAQAIGILINFIQILFGILTVTFFYILTYLLCIIFPVIVVIIEYKGLNFMELLYAFIAKIFIAKKDNKRAKTILINIISKYNESYIGHKMLAEIYENEGGMRKAIDEYVRVLDIKKNDYKSYYRISILLKDLGKKDETIEMLQKLVKQKPELYDTSEILGDLLYEKENYKEAIAVYSNAIKLNPDNAKLYYNLGITYSRTNDFQLAKAAFEKAVDIDTNLFNAYYRLGQISLLYRDFDDAERYYLQSANKEYEGKADYELAKICIIKNQKEKAVLYMNKAIELNYEYYNKISSEPILFCLRDQITKPKTESKEKSALSKKEIEIEEYLNDTYNLTKALDSKKTENKIKKFKWEN